MGLQFKRRDDLDKLFDQFALDPKDVKDPSKTPLKREHLTDKEKPATTEKKADQSNNQ